MSTHPSSERLNDFVDGELGAAEAAAVERHLEACEACREEERALRRLAQDAAALPRELPPGKDFWPAIERRLREPVVVPFARRPAVRGLGLLAAAAALVAITSAVTLRLSRPEAPLVEPGPTLVPALTLRPAALGEGPLGEVEREYERAAAELVGAINARRTALSPETLEVVHSSLAKIDEALAEIRAALAKDPGRTELAHLLSSTHRQRVELLRRVARLSRI
jgi:hypothetical protein